MVDLSYSSSFSRLPIDLTIDKGYIDGPCDLLIRKSMYKLLAEHFCNQEIPGPIRTANILIGKFQSPIIMYTQCTASIGPVHKSESSDSLNRSAKANHRKMF